MAIMFNVAVTHKAIVEESQMRYPLESKAKALRLLHKFYHALNPNKTLGNGYDIIIRQQLTNLFVLSSERYN